MVLIAQERTAGIPDSVCLVLMDFIDEIKKSKYVDFIQSIMLFGPLAKGDYNEENEIDFFIVKKETPEGLDNYLDQLSRKISDRYGKAILILDRDLALYKNPVYQHTVFYKTLQDESIILYQNK